MLVKFCKNKYARFVFNKLWAVAIATLERLRPLITIKRNLFPFVQLSQMV